MTTSLAAQLQKLAVPQTSLLLRDKKRASLLFDPKEAASIDRDTFYDIGISGLKELEKLNGEFAIFENSLFNPSSRQIERAVENVEVNKKLNKNIKKFLSFLSPYFLLKPAHKALEWLIHRFSIHEYNKEDILKLILPYHETNIFVRFIQILNVRSESDRWHWLRPLQKAGVHLPKTTLFNHAASDIGFLQFIGEMTIQFVEDNSDRANSLTTLFTFYCTSIVSALEQSSEITEPQISAILPALLKGLSSNVPDFTAATYMIAAQLLKKCNPSQKILNRLVSRLLNPHQNHLRSEATLLLVLVYQTQQEIFNTVSDKSLKNLLKNDWFPSHLGKLAVGGINILPLLIPVFKALLQNVESEGHMELFEKLLDELHFNDETANIVIISILDNMETSTDQDTTTWCSKILKDLENQYPNAYDKVVQQVLSSKNSDKHSQALSSLLNFILPVCQDDKDIFVKLFHPNPEFRASAVRFLVNNFSTLAPKEKDIFKSAVTERLLDDDIEVVKTVLMLDEEDLFELVGTDNIIDLFIKLLSHCQKKYWLDVSKTVLSLICNIRVDCYDRIFLAILPFLLPTNADELYLALHVLDTSYSDRCPILKRVKSFVPVKLTSESFCDSIYLAMAEEDCLPEVGLLMVSLEKFIDKDEVHKYISIVLMACALSQNCKPESSLKVLINISAYMNSMNIVALENIEINSPLSGHCITLVRDGNLPLQGILMCLKYVIDKTDCRKLHGCWLDLTNPDDSVMFIIHTFILLLNGCNIEKDAQFYSLTLKFFFDKFFPNFKYKVEFLANILIAQDSDDIHRTAQTQLRAAKVLNSIIAKSEESVIWSLDWTSNVLVPAVLISLANPIYEIRIIALEILANIANIISLKSKDNYKLLLIELLNRKEEILLDSEQLGLILFSIFEEKDVKYQKILNGLINVASDKNNPIHVTAMLLKILTFVNSSEILTTTSSLATHILQSTANAVKTVDIYRSSIFYNTILRFCEETADAVKLNSPVWDMLSLGIKQDIVSLEYIKGKFACPSVLILEQINRKVFANLNFEVQYALIKLLTEVVTEASNPDVVSAISRVVKNIDLDAKLVIDGLVAMRDSKSDKVPSIQRKFKKVSVVPTVDILESKQWLQGVALLEFIQNKKKLTNTALLLPVLFGILKKCLDFDEQASVEYPKQLILSAILHCCQKMEKENQTVSESTFNMELVVQCVRASQNPQTHHHALLVLAHTAALIPEQVLHNIMAIFTFMGSSVLRHDDSYSFQIISRIIETVIPILVKVKSDNDKEVECNVAKVLRVFVDVILDVPEHRRKPLFTKLITTLGVEKYLWLFLLLVYEAHIIHGSAKPKQTKRSILYSEFEPQRLSFATDIMLEYSADAIMKTTLKLLEYLKQLPNEKDDIIMDAATSIIDIKKYTPKQFRHFKYTLVTFVSGLLSSTKLINCIAVLNTHETLKMEVLFKSMIINILTYIQTISKTVDRSSGTPQAQYWKVMLHHSYDILDSINALLSSEMFLLVIRGLLVHNIQTVRRKALELLNTKLQHQPSFFYTNPTDDEITETDDLFALLPSLINIIKTINKENVEPEQELIQQTALLSLKLLIKLLADKNQEKFTPLLEFITDLIKSDKAQGNILASVVLCLAESVSFLRAHAIPGLVKFMPAMIKVLKVQKHQETPNLLLMCTVTAIQKIVEGLPLFLSPYLKKLLVELSVLSSKWEDDESNQKVGPFLTKLKAIRCNIGNSVPPRVLIPIIGETYNSLLQSKRYTSIGPLMNVLSENLSNVRGQELTVLLPDLTTFFLTALQFRTESNDVELSQINIVEDHVINALIVLVLKLSETTFRPFYYRLYDWAVRSDAKTERIITFYRLSFRIAESLKGLFVLFAGHIVKNAASILNDCNTYKTENLYFDDKTNCILLIESIIRTLKAVFKYDGQSFVDKDRFETLMQPLVDQLENKIGGLETLSLRANELIIPCIAQFAVSTADDTLWQQLNYQVLLKTRHDLPAVRLLGLNCVSAIAHKIGEDFLPLLPETIPFLAELLEDEDENVESSCQKVVQDLEKVLGEPLQKYF